MLVAVDDVLSLIPVSRSTLYALMQDSDFPKPIKVGSRVFWDDSEIQNWINSRKESRDERV